MPFEREFAEDLVDSMQQSGWQANLLDTELPNPLNVIFYRESGSLKLLVHARKITKQGIEHNRPADEMHTQMIFDGDNRGAGVRNKLRFMNGYKTVLFGFYWFEDVGYLVAAYDPEFHADYPYSKSLQLKFGTLEQASKIGIAFQTRQSDETIVAFHIRELPEYLEFASELHTAASGNVTSEALDEQDTPKTVKRALTPILDISNLPDRKSVV